MPSASEKAKAVKMSVPSARIKFRGIRWPDFPVELAVVWVDRNRVSFAVRVLRICCTRGVCIDERE